MKFEGGHRGIEGACLKDIRESLERWDRAVYECSPFRTVVGVDLGRTYPDTAVVLTYRYKPRYDPRQEERYGQAFPSGRRRSRPSGQVHPSATRCGGGPESGKQTLGSSIPMGVLSGCDARSARTPPPCAPASDRLPVPNCPTVLMLADRERAERMREFW